MKSLIIFISVCISPIFIAVLVNIIKKLQRYPIESKMNEKHQAIIINFDEVNVDKINEGHVYEKLNKQNNEGDTSRFEAEGPKLQTSINELS